MHFSGRFKMNIRYLVLLLAFSLLAACGYQLRGSADLPAYLSQPYVADQAGDWPFRRALARALEDRGATVSSSAQGASGGLSIVGVEENRTGLSVSDSGKTSEFRLALTVRYKLDRGNGLGETEYSLSARDSLRYDANSLLSSVDEERRLLDGLRADLAQRIVSRLR